MIKNHRVAQHYKNIMKKLGVEISQQKTHVSKDTYEFAKRWIKGGTEISGISLKGILNDLDLFSRYNTINVYINRVLTPSHSIKTIVCGTFENMLYKLSGQEFYSSFRQIRKQLDDFHMMMRFNSGCPYEELRNYFARRLPKLDIPIPPSTVIRSYVRAMFSEVVSSDIATIGAESYEEVNTLKESISDIVPELEDADTPILHG